MHGIRVRDREPSRIPKKWITHILKKFRKVRNLFRTYIKKKAHWSLPECIFLQIKLVKKYRHMESDVWIKEQQNTPLLQSGENIQSLKKQDIEHAKQYPHEIKSPKPNEHNNLFKYYVRKEFEGLIRFPNGRKHSKTQGHRPSCCIVFEW